MEERGAGGGKREREDWKREERGGEGREDWKKEERGERERERERGGKR